MPLIPRRSTRLHQGATAAATTLIKVMLDQTTPASNREDDLEIRPSYTAEAPGGGTGRRGQQPPPEPRNHAEDPNVRAIYRVRAPESGMNAIA